MEIPQLDHYQHLKYLRMFVFFSCLNFEYQVEALLSTEKNVSPFRKIYDNRLLVDQEQNQLLPFNLIQDNCRLSCDIVLVSTWQSFSVPGPGK